MRDDIDFLDDLVGKAIKKFFRHESFGWVEIDLNYAVISIELLLPSCSDRGNFKVLADHKVEHSDKCYIDYADGFPRYYFNFDCMIDELKSWILSRNKLEIEKIFFVSDEKRELFGDFIKRMTTNNSLEEDDDAR